MPEIIHLILTDHTTQVVAGGACILGIVSGILGVFAVLRQQSLLGDAISHATLPGVAIAFMLTQSKSPIVLLIGAALAGWMGTLIMLAIIKTTRIKKDTALGMVLSVFFGFGLMLLTIIQKFPNASQAGLNKFLFGSAATLLTDDVVTMSILGLAAFLCVLVFWKEFKILIFDYDFAKSLGFPIRFLDIFMTSLIVVAIVIGLQTVGVVLMSAMLVAPACAARQWTDRLEVMVILSAFFGAIAGVGGSLLSSTIAHLPTGPTIVLIVSFIVFVSIFFAPQRGLFWDFMRSYKNRHDILISSMLRNLLLFSEISTDPFHPHDIAALRAIGRGAVQKTMMDLKRKGYVERFPDNRWALTPDGLKEAKRLQKSFEGEM